MITRFLSIGALTLALGASVLGAGLAPAAAAPADRIGTQGGGAQIRITLDCDASPELTTITNRSRGELEIEDVGSLFNRADGEPYAVNETLRRGQSITLESGAGADNEGGREQLTDRELYDDASNRDGAKVNTSAGTFKERC